MHMPTHEQINRAIHDIEALIAGLEVVSVSGERVIPTLLEQEGDFHFWGDLTENQRRDALNLAVDWSGFAEAQKADVTRRVLDGEEADFWMDGIAADAASPQRSSSYEATRMDYQPTGRDRHIERVTGRIEELKSAQYWCTEASIPSPHTGDEERDGHWRGVTSDGSGWDHWDNLTVGEKEEVLRHRVDWEGFARSHIKDVIDKVIRDEPAERWMDSVRYPASQPSDVQPETTPPLPTREIDFARDRPSRAADDARSGGTEPEEADISRGTAMADSRERDDAVDRLVADFRARIGGLLREGVPDFPPLGHTLPWEQATEERKLENIVWESMSVWPVAGRPESIAVPGAVALEAVERHVDYAGLPAAQRELLEELRARLDAGAFAGPPPPHKDAVAGGLEAAVGVGHLERMLRAAKEGEERPWAGRPEAEKVRDIIGMAAETAAPGGYTLDVIAREVDPGRLPEWRREPLRDLMSRLDRGEFGGEGRDRLDPDGRVDAALRLAELEARVEDEKRLGAPDRDGKRWPWGELTEEQKLGEIELEIGELHLRTEPKAYEVAAREVDLARVPEARRRSFEESREEAGLGPARGQDAFDRVADDLPRRSREDGHGADGRADLGATTPPDPQDIGRVTHQVQKLLHSEFKHKKGGVKPCSPYLSMYDDPDGHELFGGLSDADKRRVLAKFVDWSGFDARQRERIVENVLDQHYDGRVLKEATNRWFEGAIPVNEEERDSALARVAGEIAAIKAEKYQADWNNTYADSKVAQEPDKYRIIGRDARESIVEFGWPELGARRQFSILEHRVDWQGTSREEQYAFIAREVDLEALIERDDIIERLGIEPASVIIQDDSFLGWSLDKAALDARLAQILPIAAGPAPAPDAGTVPSVAEILADTGRFHPAEPANGHGPEHGPGNGKGRKM
jgi:hypothetical protein